MFFRSVWLLFSRQGKWCATCDGYKQQTLVQELDVSCGCCWHHYRHENVVQSVHCPRHNVCHGMNNEPGSHRGAACSPVTCATTVHHCVLQPLIECSLYTSWLLAYNCTWLVVNKPLTSSSIVWCVFMKIYLSCLFWIYRKMYAHFIQPQNTKGRLKYEYVRVLEIG